MGRYRGVRLSLHLLPGRPAYDPTEGGGEDMGDDQVANHTARRCTALQQAWVPRRRTHMRGRRAGRWRWMVDEALTLTAR